MIHLLHFTKGMREAFYLATNEDEIAEAREQADGDGWDEGADLDLTEAISEDYVIGLPTGRWLDIG